MAETSSTKPAEPPVLRPRDRPQVRAFRMLLRAQARLEELHRRFLGTRYALQLTEFDMIAALGNTEGLRMSELAKAMITSPGNVTRVAQALEKRGLVERQRSKRSDREVIARLTPAGEEFFRDHFTVVMTFTCRLFDSALTRAQQKQLADLLEQVLERATPGEADADAR